MKKFFILLSLLSTFFISNIVFDNRNDALHSKIVNINTKNDTYKIRNIETRVIW